MKTAHVLLIVGIFVICDAVVVGALIYWMVSNLREIPAKFPFKPPLPGAVRREFQSFHIDMFSVGWGYHVEVDEDHLHLFPAKMERWLGITPASIPWSAIKPVSTGRWSCKVKIASWDVTGPKWCLELAGKRG